MTFALAKVFDHDYGRDMSNANDNRKIEAHGVKGMKSKPWRKTFKNAAAFQAWCEKNDAEVYAYRFADNPDFNRTVED